VDGVTQLVVKEPVGACAAFSPWNFPFNQAIRKISAEVGKQLSAEVGSFIKRSTIELSRDAPVIVCDAADGDDPASIRRTPTYAALRPESASTGVR
jgi:acyl-CoA reductase-like NAD-dependent aldehyde dehydrogenase